MPADDPPSPSALRFPDAWRKVCLGSIADVRFSSIDKLSYPSEESVRLCNYIDVYKNDYITDDLDFMRASATHAEIDRFGLEIGDVLLTKDSETPDDIGVPAVVDYTAPDLVCGYHLGLLRPDKNEVDPTFLAKQLGHHRLARYFGQQSNGLTRYGLPIGAVMSAPLWLPNELEEQQRIGTLLRLVDTAIAEVAVVVGKLKQVRAGLVHDLLTLGVDEQGRLRDLTAQIAEFKAAPLGHIPRKWQCQTLRDAADWFSGGTPDRSRGAWWKGDIPLLTPKDMKAFELSTTSENVTLEAIRSGSRLMPSETVFIVVRGMILAHTFPVIFATCPMSFNQDIKAVRARGNLSNRFLAHWFAANAASFLRKTTEATHGTKKLDMSELHRTWIGIPEPDEQCAIVGTIEVIDNHINTEMEIQRKLEQLKAGLSTDLLAGRVRVSEAVTADQMRSDTNYDWQRHRRPVMAP
jgi:type I restriction enzyme S subunit